MSIKKRKRVIFSIFSVLVVLAMLVSMILSSSAPLLAKESVSDDTTTNDYTTHLNNNASTRYAGRVWTDKSVYTGDATFEGDVGSVTIDKSKNADFLVSYSALATSQEIYGKAKACVDVVFVIDNSNSMDDRVGGGSSDSRLEATVDAVNISIKQIMESNENSRVAVVLYGLGAETLLPLGHYNPMSNGNYIQFSLRNGKTTFTASGNRTVDMSSSERGTNTHMGVDAGMDILANAQNIETDGYKHIPSLVLLSDGANTAAGANDWWNPRGQAGDGMDTKDSYALKVAMNAQYMKQQVNNHYGVTDPKASNAMKVYTIGMGIEQLKESGWLANNTNYYRAQMALDPGNHLDDGNKVSNAINEQWQNYLNNRTARLDGYTFEHPSSNDITTIAYNDGYYSAENAEDVSNVFDDITNTITSIKPEAPTQIEDGKPLESGYITFTDPLGKYMEVKDVNALIYGGHVFNQASSSTNGNKTTYTFTGNIESPIYGQLDASSIIIEVTNTAEHQQTVMVKIPAAAIPLRINTITLNTDGAVESNISNNAYPLRLLYSVGMESGIDESLTGVDADYINANTVNGKVNFYSNKYSGTQQNGVTVGDATVEFTPASTNPFYFVQEDTPLYIDPNGQNQATSFDENATYYLPVQYYEGNDFKTAYIARQGSMFGDYHDIKDGKLVVTKGAPRLGNLADLTKTKTSNSTDTANAYYYPTFDGTAGTGQFKIYLGNNGVAKYDAPVSLTISKKVEASDGLTAPDQTFTFEVTMAAKANSTLKGILSTNTQVQQDIKFNDQGKATITLKANESLEILNVGKGVAYTIQEINLPEGFTPDKKEVTGTTATTDAEVLFTNTYEVDPITSTELSLNLGGQKTITGRDFKAGDQFEFSIAAAQSTPNAPLPQKDGQNVTTATINPTSDKQANFAFDGVITFTKPGTYRYIIKETNNGLPGIDYDASVYRYSVTIKDNGLGKLVLDGTTPTIEKLVDGHLVSASAINFANNYSATDATVAISGMKVLNVTNSDLTLADNQFKFKIEALGSNTDGSDVFNTDNAQPMPVTTEVTNIANGDVLFGNMTFDQSMVGKTYGYKVTEILPAGVTKDNPTLNGMTYDTSEKIVKVTVSTSSEGGEHVVATITPNDNNENFTFTNAYKPTEVTIGNDTNAGIQIQSTFIGRDWTDADKFEYTISSQTQTRSNQTKNAPMPGNTKITIGKPATGNVNNVQFGEMTFTKAGTYVYEITGIKGNLGGVTYDTHTAKVTVNVIEDKATGTLSASVVYDNTNAITDGDKAVTNAAAFTNIYKAVFDDNTAISEEGTKVLNGKTLGEGEFFFDIQALNDAPLGNGGTLAQNSADGTIKLLQNIKYDKAGTYTYLISEQIPEQSQKGMTYDTSVYRVTVTVTDDQKGKLTAAITNREKAANKDGQFSQVSSIEFTNNYQPLAATYTPVKVTKQLTGDRNTPLQANEFEFEMSVSSATPSDGIQLPGSTKVKNSADGTVQFGDITFTKVGTYIVEVKEVVPDLKAPGITYDEHVIRSTFKVTDDSGQLVVSRTASTGSQTFNNRYLTSGTITGNTNLAITKVLNGRNWKDSDSFSFVLEGNNETTKQAIADGKVVLPANASGIDITGKMTDKTANFGDITFNAVGEYEFAVKEVVPQENEKIAGITYDTTVKLVKVKTTDNGDGTLAVNITENQLNSAFTNKYTPNETTLPGSENLKVTKEFTGRENNEWLDSDVFEFTIAGDPNDEATVNAIADGNIVLTETTVSADKEHHEVNFGDITFKKAGTYKFTVQETKGNFDYITYDQSVKTVVVNVTDNADGTLTATLDATSDKLEFTNTYSVQPITLDGAVNLNVTKDFTGRINDEWIAGDEFKFTLELTKGNEKNVTLPANADEITITKDSVNKTANFGDITFKAPGEYEFEVKEVKGNIFGVTYDESVKTIAVNVTDNTDGTLKIDITRKDELTFANIYNHGTVSIDGATYLKVAKQFKGRVNDEWLESDQFSFKLELLEGNSANVTMPTTTVGVDKDHKTTNFGNIIFHEPGTYKFKVTEVIGSIAGVTYDNHEEIITINVTDNGKGELIATVDGGEKVLTFQNTYNVKPTNLDGAANLKVTKVLTGRENNEWLDDDIFEFTIVGDPNDEATVNAIADGNIVLTGTTATVNKENHEASFGDITFNKAGTYKFTVQETKGNILGVTYDESVKTVVVNVTDNTDETLTATLDGTSDKLEFTNTYSVDPTTLDGAANLKVTKVLTGRVNNEWLDTDSFAFTLELTKGNEKNVTLPANADEITITKDSADKTANFGDITFKAPGEYEFKVKEVKGNIPGVIYDQSAKTVVVNVTDNTDGTLSAAVNLEKSDELTFNNIYNVGSTNLDGTANLKVTKVFTGRENNEWLDSDVFEFTIAGDLNDEATVNAIGDGSIVLTGTTATVNKENHEASFGDITFNKVGTYKFTVQETKGNIQGVTYDESVKTIVVNVVDNNDGTLTATLDNSSDKLGFSNTYLAQPITLDGAANLKVTKELTGRVNNEWLDTDSFTFTLELTKGTADNVVMPANADEITITKDSADKTASFGDVTFKAPGEYEFEVKEVKGNIPGVTYDQSVKTIVVNVTDNKDGTLSANVNEKVSDKLKFTNKYNHSSITVGGNSAIRVTKELTGRLNNEWLDTDSFTFKLTPSEETSKAVEDGLVVLPKNLEATATKANKTAVFNDIKFNEPGVYTFTVQEENGKLGGVTYDETAYPVVVTVTDDQVGHLNATITYGNNNASSLTVTNTYSTGDSTASYVIEGEKVLTGRDWHDDDVFTFVLSSNDENTLKAIENGKIVMPNTQTTVSGSDKEHKYAFDEIIFKEIGEYEFTVSEQKSDIKGITSDSHSAVVKVSVTDNNEGKIVAAGTTTQEGSLVFENTYKPVETPIAASQAIIINKTLTGRDMAANEFKFTITPENGEPIVISNKASKDGQAVAMDPYSAISFSEEGTKTFTVQEEKGKLGGVTYDTSVYQVTYEAKDNLHGEFDITRTITKDGKVVNDIHFMNTYHSNPVVVGPSGSAKLAGHKEIDNQDPNALFTMKGGEFNFEIKALGDNNAPLPANTSVQNDAKGNFVFGDITFEQIGTYRYQISEINNGLAGVSYDAKTYDIEIKVTDDNKGQLQATVIGNNEIKFVNVYDPTDVSASINGTKILTGRDMQAGEFTFILEAGDDTTIEAIKNENVVFKDNAQRLTTTNTEAGTINFGDNAITFKQAGTYTFNVFEETGTNDTITYDKNVYKVIAKVTDENGGLKVEWTNADKIAFTNSYKPHPGSVEVPMVQKVLTGRKLNAKEFTFTLSDVNGNVLKTVKNNNQGIVDFGTITFDEVGTYTYVIKETEGNAGGVTYDKSQYYVDIEVKDLDGQLTAVETVIYDSDRKPVDEIVFNNTYEAKSTEVMLGATKKLTGRELKAGEFTFILTDENGNKISQVHNDKNGVINFDSITYDKAGEYRYIISEVKGTDDTITYDSKQYNVIVKVTDNNKGNLELEVEYPDGSPVFVNSCKPTSVQTGDNSQVGLWGALAGLSIIGLIKNRSSKKRKD